jgi:hypothetical protein
MLEYQNLHFMPIRISPSLVFFIHGFKFQVLLSPHSAAAVHLGHGATIYAASSHTALPTTDPRGGIGCHCQPRVHTGMEWSYKNQTRTSFNCQPWMRSTAFGAPKLCQHLPRSSLTSLLCCNMLLGQGCPYFKTVHAINAANAQLCTAAQETGYEHVMSTHYFGCQRNLLIKRVLSKHVPDCLMCTSLEIYLQHGSCLGCPEHMNRGLKHVMLQLIV